MNVVFSSSDSYAKCTGVAIFSLLENNRDLHELNIFVFTTDMSSFNKQMLITLCQQYNRKIEVVEVLNELKRAQNDLGLLDFKGGLNTYARAMASKLLPANIEKALFIDSDLMVSGSIAELENLEMKDNIVAGVYEISVMISDLCYEDLELLNQCPFYINYGVVYINLTNWRRFSADKKIKECVKRYKKPFRIAEQSILNLAFNKKTMILPVKYNFSTILHGVSYETISRWFRRKEVFTKTEFEEAEQKPIIVHFIGDYFNRPWYKNNICRYNKEYLKYYKASPWGNLPLDDKPTDISLLFEIYYSILIFLRKNKFDNLYFSFRYRWIQWLREHIKGFDTKIKRRK